MSNYYLQSVTKKLGIAKKLNNGELGASYYEALLIISGVLSATSRILWPGENFDKKKFVELLIKYNHTENDFSTVSIPILNESKFLTKEQDEILLKDYNQKSFSQVFIGSEIDLPENAIVSLCPDINLKKLREYSYGSLFYKYVRSSIVHEYSLSEFASSYPMTTRSDFVSYINNIEYPFRRICYHFENLFEVVNNIALEVSLIIENTPIKEPANWWLDG